MEEMKFKSRLNPRISLDISVKITEQRADKGDTNPVETGPFFDDDARTKDISREGLFLITLKPLPARSPLELVFTLPETEVSVKVTGKVIWQKTDPVTGRCLAGIRIMDMDKKSAELMDRFFESASYYGWFY